MKLTNKGELDHQQIDAVAQEGSVLLVACPGSGKTRALVHKVEQELGKLSSDREFIIAITYTNTAANEIKERIELSGKDTSQLWIGTIHSFCMEWILRPYSPYDETLSKGFYVIDSDEKEEIISELCQRYTWSKIKYSDCNLIATPDGYEIKSPDAWKHDAIRKVHEEYITIVEKNGQLDFEMILFKSLNIVKKHNIIPSTLAKLFKIILIDEYQDTKIIQYHILAEILKSRGGELPVFIVGDPNQAIYQNMGGYPMDHTEIESNLGFTISEKELQNNYRSSSRLITYYSNFKTSPSRIVAVGSKKDYDSKITYDSAVHKDDLIAEIIRLIRFNTEECGISQNEICIAAPRWDHLSVLTRSLMTALPNYEFNGPGVVPFAKDQENIWFKLSRIILSEPSPEMYIRRLRWGNEFLDELRNAEINLESTSARDLLRISNSLEIHEENGLEYLEKAFSAICQTIGVSIDSSVILNSHYISFFEKSKKRIDHFVDEGNQALDSISHFRRLFKPKEGITVSTIHGIKGEEYDTVIGFGLLEGYLPYYNDPNGQESAKKLLYVLCSRARKNLHLISERGRNKPNGRQVYLPTECLSAIEFDYDYL